MTPEQFALFKLKLITWMIKKYIFYSQVEDEDFCKFVDGYSLGAVNAKTLLSRSGNTIQSWILDEYCCQKAHICEKLLGTAFSVTYLSFDLWTAPNNSAYIDVIVHYLNVIKEVCTVIIAVWNIYRDHSGINQAKAIIR